MTEFVKWTKTARYFRDIIVTEKIDGTNAAVVIEEHPIADEQSPDIVNVLWIKDSNVEYHVFAQSRKGLITPASDNFGFAAWVRDNAQTLVRDLGEGRHFGEWWGRGIQRGYRMQDRAFSLFNTVKWENASFDTPNLRVVPVLYKGPHDSEVIRDCIDALADDGSYANKGYDDPEGVCIFHTASRSVWKVTVENDESPKSLAA